MAEETSTKPAQLASSLQPERVFRPGRKGAWHLMAHREYGVIFSHCGLRVMAKDCSFPDTEVLIRDLCGTCGRAVKAEIGRERPGAANG